VQPGTRLGPYEIVALIDAGGMGEVYRARDPRLGRDIAIKVLPTDLAGDAERLKRFEREAKAMAALSHPNILAVHDVGAHEGVPYLVEELLEGESLRERLARGAIPSCDVVEIAAQIASGLAAAHGKGVVHRDLKPANIFITNDGLVKVLDFGLAKLVESLPPGKADTLTHAPSGATGFGRVLGTVAYMAPEQARGMPVDQRADIFSFGVVLYEMAGGRHPFPASSPAAVMLAVIQEIPTSLAVLKPELPAGLARLIDRCLEKDPGRRLSSAAEIRAALEACRRDLATSQQGASASNSPGVPSVAVLPFADMSPARDQEYFCDGVAEEIINALAQLEGLQVTARTSSFAFKGKPEDVREIGRRLGVGAVLEGSVRKAGERLRITVQLIDVADGYHLWSERFDRGAEDIFAVQDEISRGVVDKLKVELMAGEAGVPARRHEPGQGAHDLYLKGRYFLHRRYVGDLQRAIEHFEKAIVADAAYAAPHLGIAETFSVLGLWGFLPPRESLRRAKAAATRAIELDDTLAEAHLVLATVLFLHEWDWAGAQRHFDLAHRGSRGAGFGRLGFSFSQLLVGDPRKALEEARRGAEQEPLSPIAQTQAAAGHVAVGDIEGAVGFLEKAFELDSEMPMALLWLGFCRGAQGRLEEAIALLRSAVNHGLMAGLMFLPQILVRAGEQEEARRIVAALDESGRGRYVSPLARALALAAVGERQPSVALLEQAEAERSPMFTLCAFGPGYLKLAPSWVAEWFAMCRERIRPGGAPLPTTPDPGRPDRS
jgi:serine/threonine-protein kinase